MVDNIKQTLQDIYLSLLQLETTLREEGRLLMEVPLAPVALQTITEEKNRLLRTLAWHDDRRKRAEQNGDCRVPYLQHAFLADRWRQIQQLTRTLSQQNQLNGSLLDTHMTYTDALRTAMHTLTQTVYGADGGTCTPALRRNLDLNV